jgi:hypothetical protein
MAIQGVQNLSGITFNGSVTTRLGDYDGLEGISNPSGWQQGDGIDFGTTNNYYTDVSAIQAVYLSGVAYTDASLASATGVGVSAIVATGIANNQATLAYNSGVTYTNSRSVLAAASGYTSGTTYTDAQVANKVTAATTSGIANAYGLLAYNSGVLNTLVVANMAATSGYTSGVTYTDAQIATRPTFLQTTGIAGARALLAYNSGVIYADIMDMAAVTSGQIYTNAAALAAYNSGVAYSDANLDIIVQTFTGGAHTLTTMIAGSNAVATGTHNKLALQSGLSGFQRNILQIPGGIYYIQGPLESGLLNGLRSCYLDGLSSDNSWQLHEAFPSNDKRGTTLVFQGMTTGDIAINFPCTRMTGNNDMHGPYVFKNIRIECATGSAIQIGHPNSVGGAVGSAITRGTNFEYVSVSLSPQYWTNTATGFLQDGTGGARELARVNRTRPKTFGIRLYGPYDTKISHASIIGGYVGLDVYEADYPLYDDIHYGHQFIAARHTTRPGKLSVGGVWSRQFLENVAMCGLMLDKGRLTESHAEFGYTTPNGAYNMHTGIAWSIAGSGNELIIGGLTGGRTPYDYFEERIPFSVIDAPTNRKYWFQATGFGANSIFFSHSGDISFVNRNLTGTVLTRHYGPVFVLEGELGMSDVSASYNTSLCSGVPVGFIINSDNRSSVTNFGPAGIGAGITTGNQVVVVGHNRGTQFRNNVGVDWFGGNNILAPHNSPLADIYGYGVYDPNGCSFATSVEMSIPNRKWVATKGQGLAPASNQSINVELFKGYGRQLEDWSRTPSRYVKLVGLEPSTSINFGYAVRARNSGVGAANMGIACQDLNVTTQTVGTILVGTGFGLYTGVFTATGLGAGSYPIMHFASTGAIYCDTIIIKRLDEGEIFYV